MSISDEEAKKRASKSKRTKNANEKARQDIKDTLAKEKTKTARIKSELKAYKDLIAKGWSPPSK